ncbi:MAG TPA: helix-turn-helix domain-containing protein [Pirellulales bacterium]
MSRVAKRVADTGRAAGNANRSTGSDWDALVRITPLRPIRNKAGADKAYKTLNTLMSKAELTLDEQDYFDVLGMLVERYELEQGFATPEVSHADMLAHLIDARGIVQADVVRGTGIARATISNVLSGRRELSKANIAKLAAFFRVPTSVWI